MTDLTFLSEDRSYFPPLAHALTEPNGLLAVGGDLHPDRLLTAYSRGIFPWYSEDDPILWWSPSPRCVVFPQTLHISKSLRKAMRTKQYRITINHAFETVIQTCGQSRADKEGTWINDEIKVAYCALHQRGFAHSVECWMNDELVGGLYGISLGKAFFGESMFSTQTDASKLAFAHFAQWLHQAGFDIIDCQVQTRHLMSFGAQLITRTDFSGLLNHAIPKEIDQNFWLQKELVNHTANCSN